MNHRLIRSIHLYSFLVSLLAGILFADIVTPLLTTTLFLVVFSAIGLLDRWISRQTRPRLYT